MRGVAPACLLILALAASAAAQASGGMDVETGGLDAVELEATHALVAEARRRLPPGFLDRLDRRPTLRWRDDLPEEVHGRTRGGDIGLQRSLLTEWLAAREAGGAAVRESAALAALLHEIGHVHDRSAGGRLSSDPRLLDLAGWQVRPLRPGLRARDSAFRLRVPDAYELQSPAEFVAVNFELFLLDQTYACRRPALHAWFSERLQWSPEAVDCDASLALVVAGGDDAAIALLQIDPARVQGIDYLFADAGERAMSRWGHSMLRLVVCAPGRPPGPDCRLDLDHHLVLSFRAFVDDVQVSSWRGLTGSYPSRLFVLPLQQVIDEYTLVELRGLQSVPLRLSPAEIGALLERAAQVHWSYDGRYYFLSNNCAVETWKLLHDGVPRLSRLPLRSITPRGLLRRLQREDVADVSVLESPEQALRAGYLFASQAAYFDDMFAVAGAGIALPAAGARAWMALPPQQRAAWFGRADLRASAALLVLEQAALRREEAVAREELKQRVLRGRGGAAGTRGSDAAAAGAELRGMLAAAFPDGPSSLLPDDGYGLPQAGEREVLSAAVERDDARLRALRSALHRQAREALTPTQRSRLEGSERNLSILATRLRDLQGESGSPLPTETQ